MEYENNMNCLKPIKESEIKVTFLKCVEPKFSSLRIGTTVSVIKVGSGLLFELFFELGFIVVPCSMASILI